MNVSVVIPTRGNVDLMPIVESYPDEWQVVVYNNGAGHVQVMDGGREEWDIVAHGLADRAVYARYAAIQYASHDLIVTQDDDVIVSDPQAIVDGLITNYAEVISAPLQQPTGVPTHVSIAKDRIVCNMPQEFRHDGYVDHALVGFGAAFHRDLPERAFARLGNTRGSLRIGPIDTGLPMPLTQEEREWFHRTCDIPFTYFSPRVIVDVPRTNLEHAYADDRMYRQPEHVGERQRMLDQCRRCNG